MVGAKTGDLNSAPVLTLSSLNIGALRCKYRNIYIIYM